MRTREPQRLGMSRSRQFCEIVVYTRNTISFKEYELQRTSPDLGGYADGI